jgi:urease accessory protein UreH
LPQAFSRHAGPVTETTASGEARHDAGAVARAGVYANHVEIVVGDRELTFDFVRIDPDNRAPAR